MKVTFYKSILQDNKLTPTDKIVFCQMLYFSIMETHGGAFESDGTFDTTSLIEDYNGFAPISWRVSEEYFTNTIKLVSRRQYYYSVKALKENSNLIVNEWGEQCVKLIDLVPFFELKVDTGLSGLELIVYSYLLYKSHKYGWIDKYHHPLADDLCLSLKSLEHIILRLSQKGFLERMRKGHQVLLRPIKK